MDGRLGSHSQREFAQSLHRRFTNLGFDKPIIHNRLQSLSAVDRECVNAAGTGVEAKVHMKGAATTAVMAKDSLMVSLLRVR